MCSIKFFSKSEHALEVLFNSSAVKVPFTVLIAFEQSWTTDSPTSYTRRALLYSAVLSFWWGTAARLGQNDNSCVLSLAEATSLLCYRRA